MGNAYEFCIPTRGTKVPETPDWLHEIKYDGFRLRVERNGDRVRLITRPQKITFGENARYWRARACPRVRRVLDSISCCRWEDARRRPSFCLRVSFRGEA
jgi:hypothetical protein